MALPSSEVFKTEFITQAEHKEFEQIRQFCMLRHVEQVIESPEETNPYYVGELQAKH